MNQFLNGFNKAFENRIRLGIMSLLVIHRDMDFSALKEQLDLTDGNLSSHLSHLEKLAYISVSKQFVGKKPKTTYEITTDGQKAFSAHLDALEKLIQKTS